MLSAVESSQATLALDRAPFALEAEEVGTATVPAVHRPHFDALARAWTLAGASAFGIVGRRRKPAAWDAAENGCTAELAAPIIVGNRVWGELCVTGLTGAAAEARLAADAGLIAQLVQQEAELDAIADELVAAQDQLLALYDLVRAARGKLNVPDTLTTLAGEAARLIKADGVGLLYTPANGEPVWRTYGPAVPALADLLAQFGHLPPGERQFVLSTAEAIPNHATQCCDILIVPICVRDRAEAALVVVRQQGSTPFTSPDIKLARAIAEQTGLQLENVLLYEETVAQARLEAEMNLARAVQMRLLPNRPPAIKGLELIGRTLPALQVGGDFYDFVTTTAQGTRTCTFAVGDVSGKGLSAALVMAMVRTALRSNTQEGASPAQILEATNAQLYDDLTEVAKFATVFVGQYNPETQTLHYANAGHSPVMYRPPGTRGPTRLLEADGAPLGVLPISLYRDHVLRFDAGALLVMATDGFSEASDEMGEMYGHERLLSLIDLLADQPPTTIADRLYAAVGDFAAGHLPGDDQTLVVAKGIGL